MDIESVKVIAAAIIAAGKAVAWAIIVSAICRALFNK